MRNVWLTMIVAGLLFLVLPGCGSESKQHRLQRLQNTVSTLQNAAKSLPGRNKRLSQELATTYDAAMLRQEDNAVNAALQKVSSMLATVKTKIAHHQNRTQSLVQVSNVFEDIMGGYGQLNSNAFSIKKEHSLFLQKDEELVFCGDIHDCNEDLETLKIMNREIASLCRVHLNQVTDLVSNNRQLLVKVNWIEQNDREQALDKFSHLSDDFHEKSVARVKDIQRYHQVWDPRKYAGFIDTI